MAIALVRTILLYIVLMVGIRLMGKRQVGELEASELVLAMLLSDLAAVPMQDFAIPLLYGVVPMITLLALTMILSVLTMKSLRIRKLLCGTPTVVLQRGKMLPKNMERVRITVDELLEELRLQGVTDPTQVQYAILETSGQISVVLYQAHQPPSCHDLQVPQKEPGLPIILINDGRIMSDNLKASGYENGWMGNILKKYGCSDPSEVFLLTVDEEGKSYLILKEDCK